MKNLTFKDKVIIITGSSKGIGKVTALEFCRKGAIVVLNGRDPNTLQKTVDELRILGYRVMGITADITNIKDCENLIQTCITHYGKLDVLINNASLTMNGRLLDMGPSIFSEIFMSNSLGAIIPTQYAITSEFKKENIQFSANHKKTIELISKEFTTNEISKIMFKSPRTIEKYRSEMFIKTGTHNSIGLIMYALKNKIIDL